MKITKLLSVLTLLSILFFCACGSDDEDEVILIPNTPIEILANEYNLFDTSIKMDGYSYGLDTMNIFFNGRKDKKLWIACYDRLTKEKLFNWEETTLLDTMLTVNEGYGKTKQHHIDEFRLTAAYKKGDKYVFILMGFSTSEQRIITSDLYFVSSKTSKKEKTCTYPIENYFFRWFNPWYRDNIIVELVSDTAKRKSAIYSLDGDKIFESELQLASGNSDLNHTIPINIEEYINFSSGISGEFTRKNVKTNASIWVSEKPLADLPENTRIDDVEISQENQEYLIFNIEYTLYNGEKNTRKGKINIETGVITLI